MTELVHVFRPNILSTERSYRIGPDALEWKDAREDSLIAYREVSKVNISSMTLPFGQAQSRCVLHPRAGGKIVVSSASYKRLGVVEDRSESYVPLVRELMTRIATANPDATFTAGEPWGLWLFWLILLIASAFILLGGLILAVMGEFPFPAAAAFMIVLAGVPVGWRVVRHGAPHPFDPRTLPEGELPG
jgi:hypothetical protein